MLNFFKKSKDKTDKLVKSDDSSKRASFHSLTISDITRETADCVSVAFHVPDELSADYAFIQGQYLTLKATIKGEEIRRSYSLCSSPLDGELRVAIKKVEGGLFSTFANEELKVGVSMDVMTPEGKFYTPLDKNNSKLYIAFAAGSGITPIYSIMKSVLEEEANSRFILVYGNKTTSSIIFRNKIDALKNEHLNRLEVHHILSREDQGSDLLKGRIDAEKCKGFAEQFFNVSVVDEAFLCGPESMITGVSDQLKALGLAKDKVHFELFTSPAESLKKKTSTEGKKKSAKLESKITVILDGDETHFDLASNGFSILDAALEAGADVPYACKGAVCCTCRAKVLEGSAEMDMNYALEDDEVADGYVLTCQTHPTTERVVISFDD